MNTITHRTFKLFIYLLLFTFFINNTIAQNSKEYIKSGDNFMKVDNYKDAVESYTKALELDPNLIKTYSIRAKAYEKWEQYEKAIEDYERAIDFSPKEKELCYNAGIIYLKLNKYEDAVAKFTKAINIDNRYLEPYQQRAFALMHIGSLQNALADCDKAEDIKKSDFLTYYYRGMISHKMGEIQIAEENFLKAKKYNSKYRPAYIALATVQVKLTKYNEALKYANKAIAMDKKDKSGYHARGLAYASMDDYSKAIDDFNKAIIIDPNYADAFSARGICHKKLGQYQTAINDFTKVIVNKPKDFSAYYNRAKAYEELGNYTAAVKDYAKVTALIPTDDEAKKLLGEAKIRLFELNQEEDKPEVVMINPATDEKGVLLVPGTKDEILFKGIIKDASSIYLIKIDDNDAIYQKDSLNPEFEIKINYKDKVQISVTATDIYGNTVTKKFDLRRTETNPPEITLISPYTSYDSEIYLEHNNPIIYIEGKIEDESLIKSIFIEGANANFSTKKFNPSFSAKLDITNKKSFTITATDIYGSEAAKEFVINREGLSLAKNNPMGKTWVVFIENSNYESFASLEGPAKDVLLMKSALANYRINKIIHKKDLTKEAMDRFFAIELRDLVRSNNVNSLLVWYAGHGNFVNQTGYFIPIDAKRDDEFTYYNINSLRSSFQTYKKAVHILVVSDACESGPSFYLAMRDVAKEKRCDNWEATKFKSSQVFSSSGYELAADNSLFTKTFAKSLNFNPDACISIEKIVQKVVASVKQNQNQTPKFGKIQGGNDEGGTFFFIKK